MNSNYESLKSRDGKLSENWYIACLSKELKKNPISRTIYDEELVLFRDAEGQAVCLKNKCLHRGALLSEGRLTPSHELVCPYHGWHYSSEKSSAGKVVHIPSEGPHTKPKANLCQKSYPTIEQDGCIWVWMGSEQPKTETPPFRFPFFEDNKWINYFMITDFENEVTHLAENFMDVPHTVYVHAGWFRSKTEKKVPIKVTTNNGQVLVEYQQSNDSIGFSSLLVNPTRQPMFHTDCFIMPNITKVDYLFGQKSGFVIISQITPVTALKSRVYTAIIYKLPFFSLLMKPFFSYYTRQVINQDVEIMANQGKSFRLQGQGPFHSTGADIVHLAIERLRKQGSNGENYQQISSSQECDIWI